MVVTVTEEDDTYVIEETSTMPMGEAVDRMVVDAAILVPVQRDVQQEPVHLSMEYKANQVAIVMQEAVQ